MKIFIIYASAGQGHKRAAEAIFNSLKKNTRHDISIIDSLDYTNFLFKFFYKEGYAFLVTYFPSIWGFIYRLTDNPTSKFVKLLSKFFHKNFNALGLCNFLNKENPDLIISTHFFANEIICRPLQAKLICVITDFLVHSCWVSESVDIYVAACEETKQELLKFGVPEDKIKVLGIPVDEKFSQPLERESLCKKFNLDTSKFTVLVATGAFGFKSIERIVELLKEDAQLLIVCGDNKKLCQKLSSIKNNLNLRVFGFVENMHELMSVSDVLITKPGGLTISEALVKNLPMIFISAIAGQEENNAEFFEEQGLAINVKNINQIRETVIKLKTGRDYLQGFKNRLSNFAKVNTVKEIINLIE